MNILWDFDGTLFNTYPIYANIFIQALNRDVPEETIYKHMKISFSHAIQYFNLTEAQITSMNELEKKISPEDVLPFQHVEAVLKFAAINVIMTHKTREGVDAILDYYDWGHYFTEIITIDDGYPKKPHPASYEYLHDRHQLDLIIGDRELDILSGKQLGIKTCLFQNNQLGADYCLSDYREFFDLGLHK